MPFLATEHVPIANKDVISWIFDEEEYDWDKPIFIDTAAPSNSISARQARLLIRQLVAGFRHAGLREGDVVCIHSFNNIYYPILVLGIVATGCIFTGTNPSYTTHELQHHLAASKAKLVISEAEILSTITAAANNLQIPASNIFVLSEKESTKSWHSLLKSGEEDWLRFDDERRSRETTAILLFSSGTTGLPKPGMLSHYNLVAQHALAFEYKQPPFERKRLIALPMFHAATAPATHFGALRSGHANYIMRRFEPAAYLNAASRFFVTELLLVPPMVVALVTLPLPYKPEKLRTVRIAWAGAAALDAAMQKRFQDLLPATCPCTQIWGMTETSCFGAIFHWPESDATASVGRFLPGLDVKLVDDEDREITGYDKPGELCVRGPTVFQGYLGSKVPTLDEQGFFHTGDVLYCEGKTKLWYIVDRKKELIKVRGFQVAPAELEGVLLDHPAVGDAAVIAVMSKDGQEMPRAYVVAKEGVRVGEEELKDWVRARLAGYKRLDGGVRFRTSIPKTPSGKILKRLLREEAKLEGASKL